MDRVGRWSIYVTDEHTSLGDASLQGGHPGLELFPVVGREFIVEDSRE